jgi:hypothetical protein
MPSGQARFSRAQSRPSRSASMFGASSFSLPLYCSPTSFSHSARSMSSSAASAPRQTMFFSSWRSRGTLQRALASAVSGTPMTCTSSRNFSGGSGLVES